ncbi:MAG: DoxX family protein [Janthinobacterium lividum]
MTAGRLLMGTIYFVAGVGHFVGTRFYLGMMPDYLPAHRELVLLSGAAEMAGGLGILVPPTRRAAAWGLVLLLIVVMPANVWMVQHPERFRSIPLWALWARLPLQLPLLWWAWRYTRPNQNTSRQTAA